MRNNERWSGCRSVVELVWYIRSRCKESKSSSMYVAGTKSRGDKENRVDEIHVTSHKEIVTKPDNFEALEKKKAIAGHFL